MSERWRSPAYSRSPGRAIQEMVMSSIWRTVILALATTVSATSANATMVDVTWTGTISSGNDRTGIFGGARGEDFDLAGFGYTAVYRFDTDLGSFSGDATHQKLIGGTSFGNGTLVSPAISATIAINGVTVSVGSDVLGSYFRRSEPASGGFTGIGIFETSVIASSDTPPGVDEIFNRVSRSDDELLPSVSLIEPYARTFGAGDNVTNSNFQKFDGGQLVAANLEPTSVTVAAVPEPSTLALMIAGLGVLGAWRKPRSRAIR
jgi:hypothetical protein